jgi:hypothetical protein
MLLPGLRSWAAPLKSLVDQFEQRIKERWIESFNNLYQRGHQFFQERQTEIKTDRLGYYKLIYFTPELMEKRLYP